MVFVGQRQALQTSDYQGFSYLFSLSNNFLSGVLIISLRIRQLANFNPRSKMLIFKEL
jgi:hypothetical protein